MKAITDNSDMKGLGGGCAAAGGGQIGKGAPK